MAARDIAGSVQTRNITIAAACLKRRATLQLIQEAAAKKWP
jgi:hypothetical protein